MSRIHKSVQAAYTVGLERREGLGGQDGVALRQSGGCGGQTYMGRQVQGCREQQQ